jgi:putative addiction module antidote
MNAQVKISKMGNSAAILLSKEMLAHLDASIGENLTLTKTPRGYELLPADEGFDAQMAAAREVMARRKRALRELAK